MSEPLDLEALITPVADAMGCELVGVEFQSRGRATLLRIYIDKEGGVNIEDCERVSRQVSAVMDVEDPIQGNYTLEVSSPGLDRPLFKQADYVRFAGEQVQLQLFEPFEGRRRVKGALVGIEGDLVIINDPEGRIEIPFEQIRIARLVPQF